MPERITSIEQKFKTPEEELSYLRLRLASKERESAHGDLEKPHEEILQEEIKTYAERSPETVLAPEHALSEKEQAGIVLDLAPEAHDKKMSELLALLNEKGVRNALSIVGKMNDPHIEDDFHRFLVQYIKKGFPIEGLREKDDVWKTLHMTLFEIAVPEMKEEERGEKPLKELLSSMGQFYAGMLTGETKGRGRSHFTIEIGLSDKSDEIVFYAAVPDSKKDLFEKQLYSIFPTAHIHEQKNDYNIFVEGGFSAGSRASLSRKAILPLKTYEHFDYDPLNIVLNAFSKIEKEGGGAAVQIVCAPISSGISERYKEVQKKLQKGMSLSKALSATHETILGEFAGTIKSVVFGESGLSKKDEKVPVSQLLDQVTIEQVKEKLTSPLLAVNLRIIASAKTEERAKEILENLEAAFSQFENTQGNKINFSKFSGASLRDMLEAFSFRTFLETYALPLNIKEVTSLMHVPPKGVHSSPQFKQSKAGTAPAPMDIPHEGTLLGVNKFRSVETKVFLTHEDRLRHFYTVGQTGTGKTTLLKNMIAQDIARGDGVCMIDPHGTDIQDVLGMIPEERYDDVIYFDPSNLERVMALNMLEYDTAFPEQKTFVVNELFSIFQKLYGAVPESMGPLFEQYFRNATMLVLEDPASGGTLLDVSRVLADAQYRELKLSHCKNPVVRQFWEEVAVKAGGESALANIVPYITSKFDVFTANDYMRPIIAQEKSSLNFRRIMDERKILLVNLAKGRLGDSNSNLLGLILVGKILMAALSRVDIIGRRDVPPFYLYIDEFQNVTTDSIATILSEARKYKLSLSVAHQFIAQLDEKIRKAVFGNVGSLGVFRVGAEDAEFLVKQFEPVFTQNDLLNIENRNAYVKILANGRPTKPFNMEVLPPEKGNLEKIEALKELSYTRYARPREEIEAEIRMKYKL